jgi:hypothetical protein
MPAYGYNPNPPPLTQEELDAYAAQQEAMGGAVPAGGYDYVPVEPQYTYPEPTTDAAQGYSDVPSAPPPEPGMYERGYERPGQYAPPEPPPVQPGMYEPHYVQPGYYATRPASTYYGGPSWPTPFTGVERFTPSMVPGPLKSSVQVTTPSTGEMTYRRIPSGGTEIPTPSPTAPLDYAMEQPLIQRRGDLLGVWNQQLQESNGQNLMFQSAPPIRTSTLTRDPRQPTLDRLAGLFGGGQQRGSRPMPLPPPPPSQPASDIRRGRLPRSRLPRGA